MRITIIAVLILGLSALAQCEVTGVEFVPCSKPFLSGSKECLKITFDDGKIEYAGLTYFDEEVTKDVLDGPLFTDDGKEIAGSDVSVTRDDGIAEVMISDPNDSELYKLQVNLSTGKITLIEGPMDDGTSDDPVTPPEGDEYDDGDGDDRTLLSDRQLPTNGFRMRLQMLYDPSFARLFGNSPTRIRVAIDKILVHAKNFFLRSSSLKTRIVLDVLSYRAISQTLDATGRNLGTLRSIVRGLPVNADSYSVISYQNNAGGTIGIAYLRTTCSSDKSLRSNINEYFRGDIRTATIIVHEIGHNLGMLHDFNGRPGNMRRSSRGEACTNVGGYMDYLSSPNRWSPCSVEDFTNYYNLVRRSRGRFCLANAGSGGPVTTTTRAPGPGPSGCSDSFSYCSNFRSYCRRYGSLYYFIQMACKNTCGFCQNGQFICKDTRTSGTCRYVVRRGLCRGSTFWPTYAKMVCRKSCNLC